MNIINIGFSRAKRWYKVGSVVIAKSEARDYSHVYVEYTCQITGVELIAQASHGMVNLMNKVIFLENNIIAKQYVLQCTDKQNLDIMTFIANSLGTPYSMSQVLLLGIKTAFKFQIKSYNKDKYYICSEFAARLCKILDIVMPEELDYVTPSDLDRILSEVSR